MRCRIRCASSSLPSASNCFTCSSSSWRISSAARSIVGFEVTYCVAGKTVSVSSFASTSPVSGSKCGDLLDLVAEERDAVRGLRVRRLDLDHVALDPEAAAAEQRVVAHVLDVDQLAQHQVAVGLLADRRGRPSSARTPPASRGRRCTTRRRRRSRRGVTAGSTSPRAAAGRCRRSGTSPSRCRGRPAGRTPRAGSSRSRRRSTRPRCAGRTRGTRCRAARRASCCARSRARAAAASR